MCGRIIAYSDGRLVKGWEERLILPAMTLNQARQRHREWLNEVETKIANIWAERNGDGQPLTRRQVRALAGEGYRGL